ncbi:hypothetical protein [Burkholderia gladioli]|uniref:hypothetical protein n=1 Tax=Burkholderia gladioli TaxID=28095 RepID=UPI000A9342E1|nr:hypothetical protein [Burkholderia gladioli]
MLAEVARVPAAVAPIRRAGSGSRPSGAGVRRGAGGMDAAGEVGGADATAGLDCDGGGDDAAEARCVPSPGSLSSPSISFRLAASLSAITICVSLNGY